MANLGKVTQTLKSKVQDFGRGMESAAVSANPALIGAGLNQLRSGIDSLVKETKKESQERKRERQFDEENKNEQKKLDTDILKSLKSIEKMLGDFIDKNKKSFFDKLKEAFEPIIVAFRLLLASLVKLTPVITALVAAFISLNDTLSDFVKMFAGWTKLATEALGKFVKALGTLFDDIFKSDLFSKLSAKLGTLFDDLFKNFRGVNILEKLVKGIGGWIDDAFKAAKLGLSGVALVFLEKFGSVLDDAIKTIKGLFAGSFFTKLAQIFDVELDFIKNFKMPEGFAKVKEMFNKGITSLISFFDDIGNNPIFQKLAGFLGKFTKAIPIIGNIIMVIEGLFAVFDTATIAETLGKSVDEVGFKDRISAFFGGLVGSIFGIFDLIGTIVGAVFGIDSKEGEGESIQKQATRIATQFVDGILKAVEGMGRFIIGLLTGDTDYMSKALGDAGQGIVDSFGILLATMANFVIDKINDFLGFIGQSDKKLSKFNEFTGRQTQIATAKQTVVARGQSDSSAEWDKMYGGMYNQDGSLKNEYKKQQEELLKRATADGFYEALKRPGSLSVSEALNIQANIAEDEAVNAERRWNETQQYEAERAGYYSRFQSTLETGFKNTIDKLAVMGSTEGGAGRKWGEKLVGGTFDKLGKKIFGKETGGEIGQIFTELFGSYADQVVSQTLGPALFGGDRTQANRFFNNLVSGNKKDAQEDLLYGMFGIKTGMRSAIGYEEGAQQLAKDLAEVAGAPFAGLFGVDPNKQDPQEKLLTKTVADPIVDAQFAVGEMIVDELGGLSEQTKMLRQQEDYYRERYDRRMNRTGGGSTLHGKGGKLLKGSKKGGYFGDTAGGRIMDTALGMGQAGITKSIAGDNIFGQALVGGIVGDFTDAFMMGGEFNLATTFGNVLGIDIPPGMDLLEAVSSGYLFSTGAAIATQIGDAVAFGVLDMGGSTTLAYEAGWAAEKLGNAAIAYTISKTIAGEYSAGGWVDAATAIAGAFMGPIAGVIGGLVHRAFGMGKKRITQQGITGTLGEEGSNLVQYADWHQKGGWFRSSRSGTNYYALDPEVVEDLTAGAAGISKAVRNIGSQMGLSRLDIPNMGTLPTVTYTGTTETYMDTVYSGEDQYQVEETRYAGLVTPDGTPVGSYYMGVMRDMGVGSVAKFGDTFVRMIAKDATNVSNWRTGTVQQINSATVEIFQTANQAYAQAFKSMENAFSMQIRTSGYDMEKILEDYGEQFVKASFNNLLDPFRQTGETLVETFDRLSSAMVNFDETMYKLGYSLIDLYKTGIDATDIFYGAHMKDAFIDLYGGMEAFMSKTSQFFDLFYTQEEKLKYYEDVGRRQMQIALEESGLDATLTVDDMLGNMGDNLEDARVYYRGIVDQFAEDNKALLAANDPATIEKLAALHGDLAASYYTVVQSVQELDRISDTSRDALEAAVLRIFEQETNQFALGGIATGPETGYGATLHGTEAVVPLPNGRSIPVLLQGEGTGGTVINNNIVGNGNASVSSTPTNVFPKSPEATSGTSANRVVSMAY